MFDAKKTGQRISELRKERKWTQEELSDRMGVSAQAVSKWENGHAMPEIALLPTLAELLDCTVDALLSPELLANGRQNFTHVLLPYQDVDPYTGVWWPRSMAFPAMMAALQLFMGLQQRRNFNHHQINDDQEYILQSGLSALAFGFSHYNREFIHDCFLIYGLDYRVVTADGKPYEEVASILRRQLQKGYPAIIQDKSNNAAFLFVTGVIADGQKIRAHGFIEGFDEKNCNMNPYEMQTMDHWLKPDMDILLLYRADSKLSLEDACRNALHRYCRMMSGKWTEEAFCSGETPEFFRQFMGYGSDGYVAYIRYLQQGGTLQGLYPQQCILHESHLRTLGFLQMCKEHIRDVDHQSLNAAIGRYRILSEHSGEIINISWNDPKRTEPEPEKIQQILHLLVRSNEIFIDAVNDVKKAVGFSA